MRWGRVDFRQLREQERKLAKLADGDFDRFCRQTAQEIAQILLAKVKKRTPVGKVPEKIYKSKKTKNSLEAAIYQQYWAGYTGGSLRDAWTVSLSPISGGGYTVTIINNLEYASYVEYGHRQQSGRYVPGQYMLTISLQELEQTLPAMLQQKIAVFLQEVMR